MFDKLEGDAEIGGARQRLLVVRVDAHDDRHHAADRAGDMVAIAEQVRLVGRPPALGVEREAGEMIVDVSGAGSGIRRADVASASKGSSADRLAGERVWLGAGARRAATIAVRPIRLEAERLAVADVVAMAAPGIEQPGALARPAVEQAAGDAEGFASPRRIDSLGLGDELGRAFIRARSSIISPAVALALPTTPGNAGAGMGARADEIEVRDRVVAIVHPEPGALGQQRLEAEGGAEMRAEIALEIAAARKWNRIVDPLATGPASARSSRISRMRSRIGRPLRRPSRAASLPRCGTGASA